MRSQAAFTNSELSLKHVDVYGFDFDYTLLQYTPEVHKLIYTVARKRLVEKLSVRPTGSYMYTCSIWCVCVVGVLGCGCMCVCVWGGGGGGGGVRGVLFLYTVL